MYRISLAIFLLFFMLFQQVAYSKDESTNISELIELANKQNSSFIRFMIGMIYLTGSKNVPVNYDLAVEHLRIAVKQNDRMAQSALADVYFNNIGGYGDKDEAIQLYYLSAQQGFPVAEYNLGVLNYNGDGVPQDFQQAYYWLSKSAKNGFAPAQYYLGKMYHLGAFVKKDSIQAYAWMSTAAARNNNYALTRDLYSMQLNKEQLQTAQQLSQQYFSDYPPSLDLLMFHGKTSGKY